MGNGRKDSSRSLPDSPSSGCLGSASSASPRKAHRGLDSLRPFSLHAVRPPSVRGRARPEGRRDLQDVLLHGKDRIQPPQGGKERGRGGVVEAQGRLRPLSSDELQALPLHEEGDAPDDRAPRAEDEDALRGGGPCLFQQDRANEVREEVRGLQQAPARCVCLGEEGDGIRGGSSVRLPSWERKEKAMWDRCVRYYGHQPRVLTSPCHEPVEWKSGGDGNGGGVMTELLTAPPADTSEMGSSHAPQGALPIEASSGRAGRAHPNGYTSRRDGARGHRVSPPPSGDGVARLLSCDTEDTVIW